MGLGLGFTISTGSSGVGGLSTERPCLVRARVRVRG